MNYEEHYFSLLDKHGSRSKPQHYAERHHIMPKCLGGKNVYSNLIYLSPRCHLLAHWLLMRAYPEVRALKIAYATMCSRDSVKLSPKMYELAKMAVSGDNSMLARAVVTPMGRFPTVAAAAAAHKVSKAIISRKAGSSSMLHRGYYWLDNVVQGDTADGRNAHHLRKGVRTPYGIFESVREAGRVLEIHHSTISKRIRQKHPGYSYL